MKTRTTNMTVVFSEDQQRTDAKVTAVVRGAEFTGQGQARRNPDDPQVPQIGEELALARALADLSHQLLDAASEAIEAREGHEVILRL